MSTRRVVAEISLKNINENISTLYNHMPNPKPIIAVIKANGYGHGAIEIAKSFEDNDKIYGYAVATAEEALQLRNANILKPILILGYVFEEDYKELIVNDIMFSVFEIESARRLSKIAKSLNTNAKINIKVDTGMSRIGVRPDSTGLEIVENISKIENLDLYGIFTHFARADELDLQYANNQFNLFSNFIKDLSSKGINFKICHCSNSAAILQYPEAHLDIVRAGIVIYGLWPSNEMMTLDIELKPAMTLKSHITYIKDITAGTAISYGGTFVAEKDMKIATIPVGYADGYPRSLSSKGYVLINGQKANILGRVCMDQMMVDVTNIDANPLDEVILLGKSVDEEITAEILGDMSGRFNYELVCDFTSRVPREYV